jgi:protein tyrosine phosphatase domain-containing protein 1
MDLCLKGGKKVAVHCHAGRGRTGLIICAYLIYKKGFTAEKAIKEFRDIRVPSLGKAKQRKTIHDFEKCKPPF